MEFYRKYVFTQFDIKISNTLCGNVVDDIRTNDYKITRTKAMIQNQKCGIVCSFNDMQSLSSYIGVEKRVGSTFQNHKYSSKTIFCHNIGHMRTLQNESLCRIEFVPTHWRTDATNGLSQPKFRKFWILCFHGSVCSHSSAGLLSVEMSTRKVALWTSIVASRWERDVWKSISLVYTVLLDRALLRHRITFCNS